MSGRNEGEVVVKEPEADEEDLKLVAQNDERTEREANVRKSGGSFLFLDFHRTLVVSRIRSIFRSLGLKL